MLARWWTFGIWALVAGSAVFWGLRIFAPASAVPPQAQVAQPGGNIRGDLTRLFGADIVPAAPVQAAAVQATPDPRFTLLGVVSPRNASAAGAGVALIAIDGNPPKAYRVGMAVDGATVLQTVSARGVQLGPRGGPATVALELPPLPPPATGTLPSPGKPGSPGSPGFQGAAAGFGPQSFRPGMPFQQQPDYAADHAQQQQDAAQAADQVNLR
jgi:general secretion pathway protein C